MKKLFFVAVMSLLSCQLFAQVRTTRPAPAAVVVPPPLATREVSGIVKDSKGDPVIGATLTLSNKAGDTIHTATNADGIFVFREVKSATFTISVESLGYTTQVKRFSMNDVAKHLPLEPFELKDNNKELSEVTINGTPSIVYKTDTVEYRASDYKVRENSTVDELLKHMEGFEVGSDGSVTHQGQAVTKARLNGRDYSGGNLAQAIQSLPADIVEKIQVVDDYGDQAARTGVKDGDPTKVLNITTLANKSIGNIGRATVSEGTENVYNEVLFYNRINANQVIVFNGSVSSSIPGLNTSAAGSGSGNVNSNTGVSGLSERGSANASYRDQVSKTTQINGSYTYGTSHSFTINSSDGGSFNNITLQKPTRDTTVTTIDTTSSINRANSFSHNFTFDYEWQQADTTNYIRIRPNYSYSDNASTSSQYTDNVGYQYNSTASSTTSTTTSPSTSLNATYQHLWKKDKRQNISLAYTYSNNGSDQLTATNQTILYRSSTGVPVKDSLVNRSTTNNQTTKTSNINLQYVQPLSKVNAPVQQLLEFNEIYNDQVQDVTKIQSNVNAAGQLSPVDSLSNIYHYSFSQLNLAAQYRRNGAKSQLTLGARVIFTDLSGDNITKNTTTNRTNSYILPVFRYQYQWTRTEQISVNYNGTAREPTFAQIQPVPDYSGNAQAPVYGNPDLKPAFNHTVTTRFNDYIANSKFNFSLNSSTTYTQDQIVTNNILTSQTIKVGNTTAQNVINQQHYLNTSGAFSEAITHNVAKQLNDRAYNLELNGTIGYSYNPIYNNSEPFHQVSWHFNERFGPRINPNTTFEINPYVSYDIQRSFNSIPSRSPLIPTNSDLRQTILDLQGRIFLGKERRFTFEYEVSKNYITYLAGAAGAPTRNPFIASAWVEYEFFARKNGLLRLSGNDIFKQAYFFNHSVSATGYTNTVSNTLSRYFTLSFVLNLSKFSGTPMRNGVPQRRRGDGSFIVD